MPRPNLMPLTGGYRRTPVVQIGADIFCDTQIIVRELEARFPTPTLFPEGHRGVPWALGLWSDRPFFQSTVNLIFGALGDKVPQDFIEDRERLRGAKFDIEAMRATLPQMRDQFRAHTGWIEAQLSDGRQWLLGAFSLADVNAYMNIWYTRANLSEADQALAGVDQILARCPNVQAWEKRMHGIGHGSRSELSAEEASDIAAHAEPQTPILSDADDPNGRQPGDQVSVMPDDYGKVEVTGNIVALSAQHIAIRRRDDRVGEVVVHFPRAGFTIRSA